MVRDVASRRLGTSENSPSRIFLVQEYLQQIKTPAVPVHTAGVCIGLQKEIPPRGIRKRRAAVIFPVIT